MRIAVSRTVLSLLSGAGLLVGASASAESGALHRWVTADGTVSYTDDAKRVPEKYRDSAETIERGMLTDYGRYTTTDSAAHQASAEQLAKRLEALRAANGMDEAARDDVADADEHASPTTSVARTRRDVYRREYRRGDGTKYHRYYEGAPSTIPSLPVDPNDPSPVITEERHMLWPGRTATETVTVTRQGDRILSIYRPRSTYHSTTYPKTIEELLEDE
jgi:Domain of unknown function (DUF4124)